MKPRLLKALDAMKRYNAGVMSRECFGFEPEVCFQGSYAGVYLQDRLGPFTPFAPVYPPDRAYVGQVIELGRRLGYPIQQGKVFCTDSIAFEYIHLDEIRAAGAELIEMETALFYQLADLFEVPAVALLAVSDNAATGAPLLGRE